MLCALSGCFSYEYEGYPLYLYMPIKYLHIPQYFAYSRQRKARVQATFIYLHYTAHGEICQMKFTNFLQNHSQAQREDSKILAGLFAF